MHGGPRRRGSLGHQWCAASDLPSTRRRNAMATPNEDVVGKLNSFLRGEISAVETYRQALDKITDPAVRTQLETCEQDHARRIDLLRARISSLGGTPDQSSGAWGVWAKIM